MCPLPQLFRSSLVNDCCFCLRVLLVLHAQTDREGLSGQLVLFAQGCPSEFSSVSVYLYRQGTLNVSTAMSTHSRLSPFLPLRPFPLTHDGGGHGGTCSDPLVEKTRGEPCSLLTAPGSEPLGSASAPCWLPGCSQAMAEQGERRAR